jgi:GDSL-like lipase/acylhydrolase family protein
MRRLAVALFLLCCCGFTAPVAQMTSGGLVFNLTGIGLPQGLVATRTGATIYPQRSSSSAVAVTGADVYEDRGDARGGGHWTFPAYTNDASPFDLTAPGGHYHTLVGGQDITANAAIAPDGTTTADRLTETDTTYTSFHDILGASAAGQAHNISSVWVKDGPSPPAIPGSINSSGQHAANYLTSLGSGSTWRRVVAYYFKPASTPSKAVMNFYYAGMQPSGSSSTATNATTGSIYAWGQQVTQADGNVPLVDGATGALTIALDSSKLGQVLQTGGDFHISGSFLLEADPWGVFSSAPTSETKYFFSMTTPDGETSLQWAFQTGINGVLNGSAYGSYNLGFITSDGELRWEYWSKPSSNTSGHNVFINGCRYGGTNLTRGAAVTIKPPTAFNLGSKNGTSNILPRRHTFLSLGDTSDPEKAEGVLIGDSLLSIYVGGLPMVGSYIYTLAESRTRRGIVSMADAGFRLDQLLTTWQLRAQRGRSDVSWIIIQAGINDIVANVGSAMALSRLQTLITDIRTNNPGATLFVSPLVPCRAAITAGQYTDWLAFNAGITGLTGTFTKLPDWTAMNDGSGNLAAAYNSGDGIHTNLAGRIYQAAQFRAAVGLP